METVQGRMKLEHAASPNAGITLNGVDKILPSRGDILKVNHVASLNESIKTNGTIKVPSRVLQTRKHADGLRWNNMIRFLRDQDLMKLLTADAKLGSRENLQPWRRR